MKTIYSRTCGALLAATLSMPGMLFATDMSSANYSIKWDVADGGGGNSTSANYIVEASAGQPTAIGESNSTNYKVVAGFESIPDSDADRILNAMDNCTTVVNPDQRDTDSDGFGNICDADLNNSGRVNATDLAIFKTRFRSSDPDADFNGDGRVNATDLAILKTLFAKPPGPSGIAP